MLNVVSNCIAELLPTGVVYEKHSGALLDRSEVMVKETSVKKCFAKGHLVGKSLLDKRR